MNAWKGFVLATGALALTALAASNSARAARGEPSRASRPGTACRPTSTTGTTPEKLGLILGALN